MPRTRVECPALPADLLASIVIPAKNEAQNLDPLIDEIAAVLAGEAYEIVVVNDGSTDDTASVLAAKRAKGLPVRHIRHPRSLGKSAGLRTGMLAAKGRFVVTVDGDGQNDPRYIPEMLARLSAPGSAIALVVGQRENRTDGGRKKYASRFANKLRARVLKDGTRDSGCGLRALRRDVFALLPYFDGLHRFLPALVLREGYAIDWIDIVDRPRQFGQSHYGIVDRGVRGVLDLFGVWWLKRRFRGRADAVEE